MKHDKQVNTDLEKKGWTVLRFWQNLYLKILIITLKLFYGI